MAYSKKPTQNPLYYEDFWHTSKEQYTFEDLQAIRTRLAKQANQRLVRLERNQSKVTGEMYSEYGSAEFAYDYLQSQNRHRFSEQKKAFSDAPAETKWTEIKKELAELQAFLRSKTSTVAGQRDIEHQRIETFNKPKYDEHGSVIRESIKFASNKEFYDFLNSQTYKDLTQKFDSNTIVETYDRARQAGKLTHEEIMDTLEEYRTKTNQSVKGLRNTLGLTEV